MKCPKCGENAHRTDRVTHRTDADGWSMVVRRRRCPQGHTFETFECYEYADVEVVFRVREAIAALLEITTDARP
jgi:transcriptional regulator NrdR family protein